MSSAFSSKLLFFSMGLFVSDVFFGGSLFFPIGLFMSSVFSGRSFRWVYLCLVSFYWVVVLFDGSICTCGI